VKDLVDMLLLVDSRTLDSIPIVENLNGPFRRRATHDMPGSLPPPPPTCEERFGELASECCMNGTLLEHHRRLDAFLAGIQK